MNDARIKREASVLRYKKKRKNRLSSGKIRYEVRKINADKRARFKVVTCNLSPMNGLILIIYLLVRFDNIYFDATLVLHIGIS